MMSAAATFNDVQTDSKYLELDGVNDDRVRRALMSFASLRRMEVAPEPPSAFQLMSETREAIAQVRKSIAADAMDGSSQASDTVILTNGRTRTIMASSEDVEESLVELQQATEACRSFAVPNAGSVARAAGSTVISRLRPTVVPPVGASLLSEDVDVVEEREGAEAARAAWHATRRQQLLAAGGGAVGDAAGFGDLASNASQTMNGDNGQTTIMLKSLDGRNRRMSVPFYLLQQHQDAPSKASPTEQGIEDRGQVPNAPTVIPPLGPPSRGPSFRRPSSLTIPDTHASTHAPPSRSTSLSSDQWPTPDPLAQPCRTAPLRPSIGGSTINSFHRSLSSSTLRQVALDAPAPSQSLGQLDIPNVLLRPPSHSIGGMDDEAAADAEGTTSFARKHRPARKVVSMASLAVAVRGSGAASPQPLRAHTPSSRLGMASKEEATLLPSNLAGARRTPMGPPGVSNTPVRRRGSVQILLPSATSPKLGRLSNPLNTTQASSALGSKDLGSEVAGLSSEEGDDPIRAIDIGYSNGTGRGPPGSRTQAPGAVPTCPALPSLAQFTNGPSSHVSGDGSSGLASMLAALATGHAEVERVRRKVGAVGSGQTRVNVEASREHLDAAPSLWR